MNAEQLEVLLEITLGAKVASEVTWEAGGDPSMAAEVLHRRAATLAAPLNGYNGPLVNRGAQLRKDVKRLQLLGRLIEELSYELNEEYDVELVRTA
ncbi:MAG TPA: hypothetical protein VM121_02455 [Acidimicrobiales bacterium]|nr:hypothetical protein [Acidimicrobiales bacterium]